MKERDCLTPTGKSPLHKGYKNAYMFEEEQESVVAARNAAQRLGQRIRRQTGSIGRYLSATQATAANEGQLLA